jgi:hypothetical protein
LHEFARLASLHTFKGSSVHAISCGDVDGTFVCSGDALCRLLANFLAKLPPAFLTMLSSSFEKLSAWLYNESEV